MFSCLASFSPFSPFSPFHFHSLFALPKLPSTAFTYIMGKQIYVRETVNEALPLLPMPNFPTNANAVHRRRYYGELKNNIVNWWRSK